MAESLSCFNPYRTFRALFFTVGWWTWAFKVTCILGGMGGVGMLLWCNSSIEPARWRNGENFTPKLKCFTRQQPIQTTTPSCWTLNPFLLNTTIGRKCNSSKKNGWCTPSVRIGLGPLGVKPNLLVALCSACLRKLNVVGWIWWCGAETLLVTPKTVLMLNRESWRS